jgi:predicted amidophosphoribosyltransferase
VAEPLARVREAGAQRGAGAPARARQVAGAFAVRDRERVPAHPWLVDDVHTTGATLADCARALRAGGARRVGAVCFARALRER